MTTPFLVAVSHPWPAASAPGHGRPDGRQRPRTPASLGSEDRERPTIVVFPLQHDTLTDVDYLDVRRRDWCQHAEPFVHVDGTDDIRQLRAEEGVAVLANDGEGVQGPFACRVFVLQPVIAAERAMQATEEDDLAAGRAALVGQAVFPRRLPERTGVRLGQAGHRPSRRVVCHVQESLAKTTVPAQCRVPRY